MKQNYRIKNHLNILKKESEYRIKKANKIKIKNNNYKKYKSHIKEYYKSNKKKILLYQKNYRQTNKIELQKQKNIYLRKKYKQNLSFRILDNLRTRTKHTICGINKSDKTIKLLGCSIPEFRKHIEKQFKPGMTWKNHSLFGWHLDHILPCASFDLTKPEEQKKCFHYTNLQPLWAEDNLRKGDKIGIYNK